ncbi:MAG: copper chaperone PCu(A)C [Pseudomonadota bacterium]
MKRSVMAGALAMVFVTSACGAEAEAPVVEEVEGVIPGMSIANARMVLAPVAGNPAAVYFDLTYEGTRGLTIRKAEVAQASSAMLHDYGEYDFKVQMMEALPIAITEGSEIAFEPGGLHVMAFEPSEELQPGGTAEVTLTVSGGQTHTFEAEVRAAGEER